MIRQRICFKAAREFDCRLVQWRNIPYFQNLETTGFTQGRSREVADGTNWLQLGHCNSLQSYSRTCARLVKISPHHSRDEIYARCSEFGEVIALYFVIKKNEEGFFYYDGTGFVQLEIPVVFREL
eukprot:12426558-Karenia_brevis.AAC.1